MREPLLPEEAAVMADVREILRRFRPAAAPGPAGSGGVPADRPAEREAELAPVFALLEDVERECAQVVDAARVAAEERRAQARLQAEAILAEGRRRAEVERVAAAAVVRRTADDDAARMLAEAREEARLTAEIGARRLPEVVDEASARLRALLTATPGAVPP